MIYLILLAATSASTGKTVFMKKIGVNSDTADKLIMQNAISFVVAALIPLAMLRFDLLRIFYMSKFSLYMSVLFAISIILTYLTQMKAMALGNSSSTMLIYSSGFLIPIIFSAIRYGEKISIIQFWGLFLLMTALYFIINPKKDRKFSLKWLIFSLLSMTGSGCTAVLQKIHQHSRHSEEFLSLLSLEFILASVILFVITPFFNKKTNIRKLTRENIFTSSINGVFIGVLNMLNLHLAGRLPAVIVFPIYNIGSLVLSGVILSILFKEKASKMENIGFLLGISGIMLIGIG